MKQAIGTTGVVLAGVALLVGLILAGWWYREWAINREAEIQRDSFNFQGSLRDELVDQADDLAAIDSQLANPALTDTQHAALTAQRAAMVDQLCSVAADLTGDLSPIHTNIITKEC